GRLRHAGRRIAGRRRNDAATDSRQIGLFERRGLLRHIPLHGRPVGTKESEMIAKHLASTLVAVVVVVAACSSSGTAGGPVAGDGSQRRSRDLPQHHASGTEYIREDHRGPAWDVSNRTGAVRRQGAMDGALPPFRDLRGRRARLAARSRGVLRRRAVKLARSIAMAIAIGTIAGCGGGGMSCPNDLPGACPSTPPSYSRDISQVISARCFPCHAPGGQEAGKT